MHDTSYEFYSLIDAKNVGLMGHSLGGSAVLGVGRQRDDIKAVICLESAFLCDIQGVDKDGKFIFDSSDYPIPVLNVYSDSSYKHLNEWSQYAENANLLNSTSPDVENVYLSGIGHFSLTDLSLTSPFITAVFDGHFPKDKPQTTLSKLNNICLTFLDKHMRE